MSSKNPGKKMGGFTLIELIMVLTILCVLAAIALSQFTMAKMQGYNASSKSDLKNAYTAAQSYYGDNPTGNISSTNDLERYGFRGTGNVNFTIVDGREGSLSMTAIYGVPGATTYSINSMGSISP